MEARLFATESPRFLAHRVRSRVGSQRPPKILNLFFWRLQLTDHPTVLRRDGVSTAVKFEVTFLGGPFAENRLSQASRQHAG